MPSCVVLAHMCVAHMYKWVSEYTSFELKVVLRKHMWDWEGDQRVRWVTKEFRLTQLEWKCYELEGPCLTLLFVRFGQKQTRSEITWGIINDKLKPQGDQK